MTPTLHRTLFVVLAAAAATPTPALAQAAATPRAAADASSDPQTTQDREAVAAAEQLAADTSQVLEQWIMTQAITEDRLFSRLYFPLASTDPKKYSTPYDALAERDIVAIEDKALARSSGFHYAILTDLNAYVPAYNTRFAQPLTGHPAEDYVNNRTKRMLGDPASLLAARSEARNLVQRTRLETGDVIYDVSVPVIVRGKHWGCVRIGYRRSE
jgi:methyl-accepting chemotaxis protein